MTTGRFKTAGTTLVLVAVSFGLTSTASAQRDVATNNDRVARTVGVKGEGIASAVVESPVSRVVPSPSRVVVCVERSSSQLFQAVANRCDTASHLKRKWRLRGAAPQMCVNTLSREMTLSSSGKCRAENAFLARASANQPFLGCADKDTGRLRWPRTGVCWWQNTSLVMLAMAKTSAPTTSTTTTTITTTTTTTTATTTTTVPTTTTTTTTVAPSTYSVSYNGNTSTSGAVPSDVSLYSSGATVTVAGNSGSLAKTGYTFGGWCTTQPAAGDACSGTSRAAASTFTITSATTLYAVWTLAAPAFTLSSSSESKAQNTAITGYTISSTGGTIASYAISPAAPTGLTFNTSTGRLTGTPTTVQAATAYTITATNATGTATRTFTLTVTVACADGGVCVVGDTGPGGGKVFYVQASGGTFACGATLASTCKYLEAAPANWQTHASITLPAGNDPQSSWATNANSNQSTAVVGADGTLIGTGYQNSLDIVAQAGNVADTSAAVLARAYQGNSKTDWHLPSKDEGSELQFNRNSVGGYSDDNYWSSSETAASGAWRQSAKQQFDTNKVFAYRVRPVRAFG